MSPGAVRDALTAMWGDTCYICGALLVVSHIEHVRPRSAGGGDSWANLRLSCPSCNWSKGAKSLKDFLAGRDGPVARSAKRAGRYPSPGQMRAAELRPTAASFARHPGYAAAAVAVAAAGVAAVVWWRRRRAEADEQSEQAGPPPPGPANPPAGRAAAKSVSPAAPADRGAFEDHDSRRWRPAPAR